MSETTTEKMIDDLRSMQKQIIHGKNTFGDIADRLDTLRQQLVACEASRERLREALLHARNTFWTKCEGQHKWTKEIVEKALNESPSTALAECFRERLEPVRNELDKVFTLIGEDYIDCDGYALHVNNAINLLTALGKEKV
jgi:septation ring formation regulator EzrA